MARTPAQQREYMRNWRTKTRPVTATAKTWTDVLTEVTGDPPDWQETIQKMHQAHIDRVLAKVRKAK